MWYINIKKAYGVSKRCKMSQVSVFFLHICALLLLQIWPVERIAFRLDFTYSNLNSQSIADIFKVFYTNIKTHSPGWYLIFFCLFSAYSYIILGGSIRLLLKKPWQHDESQVVAKEKGKNLSLLSPCKFCYSADFPVKNVKISSMNEKKEGKKATLKSIYR